MTLKPPTDPTGGFASLTDIQDRLDNLEDQVFFVDDYGAVGNGTTDDTSAINTAIIAADGAKLIFRPGAIYLYSSILRTTVGGITLDGQGATLKSSLGKTVNTAAFWIKGSDVTIRDFKFDFVLPVNVATEATTRAANAHTIRVGGTNNSTGIATRILVENVKVVNSRNTPLLAQYSDRLVVRNCTFRDGYGNGLFIGDSIGRIRILGNTIYNTGDDGIAVFQNTANGFRVVDVVIANNHVELNDAKGIGIGADNVAITGNVIRNTYTGGIHLIEDLAFNLYGCRGVSVTGNTIDSAGKNFGARDGHAVQSAQGYGIVTTGINNTVTISGNIVTNTAARGISAESGAGTAQLNITGNVIRTAGSGAIVVGNIDGVTLTDYLDVVISDNVTQGTVDGIRAGTITGLIIQNNHVRSFKSGDPSGGLRGITVGRCDLFRVTGNLVNNDDGASQTIRDHGNNSKYYIGDNQESTAGVVDRSNAIYAAPFAASFTPIVEFGDTQKITLTNNITIHVPATQVRNQRLKFILVQDVPAAHTITFDAGYKKNWVPVTTPSAINTIEFVYDGTSGFWMQIAASTGLT